MLPLIFSLRNYSFSKHISNLFSQKQMPDEIFSYILPSCGTYISQVLHFSLSDLAEGNSGIPPESWGTQSTCLDPPSLPPSREGSAPLCLQRCTLKKNRESTGCGQKTKTCSDKSIRPSVKLQRKRNSVGDFKNRPLPKSTACNWPYIILNQVFLRPGTIQSQPLITIQIRHFVDLN